MRNIFILTQGAVLLFVLASCSIYHNPVFLKDPRDAEVLLSMPGGPLAINNNHHNHTTNNVSYNWNEPASLKPAESPKKEVVVVEKSQTHEPPKYRKIKVGCDTFVMPELAEPKPLTKPMVRLLQPESTTQLNTLLLDNIAENISAIKSNKKLLEEALKKHLESCKW